MDNDYVLIANFIYGEFELLLSANPEDGGTVSGSGKYLCNELAIYEAIPNDCYIFLHWEDANSGEVISTNPTNTILMLDDRKLIAIFERDYLFSLTTKANPEEGGAVKENYIGCSTAVYTAIPNDCYRFLNWTDANSGEVVSTKLVDTVEIVADRTFIANFEFYDYNFNLSSSLHLDGTQLSADYRYTLGTNFPKLRFKLNSDAPTSELNKITELNISFDYSNVFARVNPNSLKLLDLPSDWVITNSSNSNDFERLTSNYTVTLSNPSGLSFADNLNLFEVDILMALPNSDMLKGKIENEHYNLLISPVFLVQTVNCITIESDTSLLNIHPICAIDFRILNISDTDFDLKIIDNSINYSVAFDCDASLTIYNSLGQAILIPVSGAINKGIYKLDISDFDFPTGAYFCELKINGVYRKVVGMVIAR
jgi:hypothetical protein